MVAQFIENLVHFEGCGDGLNQHGGADGALGNADVILREDEDVIPQASFVVALQLRQVEVWAGAGGDLRLGVMKEEQSEVEK